MSQSLKAIWDAHIGMNKQDMRDHMWFLRSVAAGNMLEIGVRGGVSTAAILLGMDDKDDGHLCSIDIDETCSNVIDHPRWTFMHGDSQAMPIYIDHGQLEILLIDGDHSYAAASSDLRRFSPLVKSGGFILMHDVIPSDYARSCCSVDECRKAWDDFCRLHSDWPSRIMPGLFGMEVIHVQ